MYFNYGLLSFLELNYVYAAIILVHFNDLKRSQFLGKRNLHNIPVRILCSYYVYRNY